jgi:hypothetical protein
MKKVKIIANKPPDVKHYSDISKFIGYEYEVLEAWEDGNIEVNFGKNNILEVYLGEYEIIE